MSRALALTFGLISGLTLAPCQAETFIVENLLANGPGSLRAAIDSSNLDSEPDRITFSPNYQSDGPHTITLDAPLIVTAPVAIIGPGRDLLFINGAESHRVFDLSGSTRENPHLIQALSIQNGRATLGGANLRVFGSLELIDCALLNGQASAIDGSDNNPGNADGGGLFHSGDNLFIDSCLFQNNHTIGGFSQGGGLYTELGTATILNSRIVGNTTDGNVSEGGGIGSRSIMIIENSEIAENETINQSSGGGGIYADANITLRQCTISRNVVGANTGITGYSVGGAFANVAGSATFEHCTITENSAPTGMGQGAGISSISFGVLSFHNCIVAGNGSSDLDQTPFRQLRYRDDGFNLFGNVTNTNLNLASNQALTSRYGLADPRLSALAFHGGSTRTQVPLPGPNSLALNAGPPSSNLRYDQRGIDFPRLIGAALDIGASERQDFIDSDLDGLPDAIESLVPGLTASNGDLDQDGLSDLIEFQLSGTLAISDPNLQPTLQIQALADRWQLQFPTNPNREYRVLFNTDLASSPKPLQADFQMFSATTQATIEFPSPGPRAFFFLEGSIPAEPIE